MEMLLREAREHDAEAGVPPEVAEEEALWEARAEDAPPPEDEPPAAPGEAWDRDQGGEEQA